MPMRKTGSWCPLGVALAALVLLVLAAPTLGSQALSAAPAQPGDVQVGGADMFNVDLQLPDGSRIDYLRLYYYDTDPVDSTAWLTRYDHSGGFTDVLVVSSQGSSGFGSILSAYSGQIVDAASYTYVLNWQPTSPGENLQLCALRVAYRLDGGASDFCYLSVAGTALRPRDGRTRWGYGGGGCLYQAYHAIYLPLVVRGF